MRRSLVEIAIPLLVVELNTNLLSPLLLPLLPCTDVKVSLNPFCRAAARVSGSDMAWLCCLLLLALLESNHLQGQAGGSVH